MKIDYSKQKDKLQTNVVLGTQSSKLNSNFAANKKKWEKSITIELLKITQMMYLLLIEEENETFICKKVGGFRGT